MAPIHYEDESWIHHYAPKTKLQSKQYTAKRKAAHEITKTVISIDFLQKQKNHYGSILNIITSRAKETNYGKRPHFQEKKICLTKTARRYFCVEKIHQLRLELLDHPSY